MIRQNYNHPAVVVWGMYNEIGNDPTSQALVSQLVAVAHAEDPTRPTTDASDLASWAAINFIPDVNDFNEYFGWYMGSYNDFGTWADTTHFELSAAGDRRKRVRCGSQHLSARR